MLEGLFLLLSLSLVMAVASLLAGLLPLSFGLSSNHSRIISAIGTGVLVGTCLIVIIPEGIDTIYDTNPSAESSIAASETAHSSQNQNDPHAWIGLALILGFILMYLIDELPKHFSSLSSGATPLHISLSNLSQGPHRISSIGSTAEEDRLGQSDSNATRHKSATTIGLVIHAAADGIALGASSFLEKSSVGLVVFLAIMIHKAPAAFGLTSVLLKQGLAKRMVKIHLVIFSLAAPVGALTTWVLVNVFAGGHIQGGQDTKFVTGLLLIFSGGTFLYVAMHTMQDVGEGSHGGKHHAYANNQYTAADQNLVAANEEPSIRDTSLTVIGMLLPLLTQIGHAH